MTFQLQAYQYIKENILAMRFKPGEYITDSQISNQLKISRTPVREAFRRLEKEGLLVNEAYRGWKIYTLNVKDIQEIFDLKIAIEGMVARKAAECGDEGLRNQLIHALKMMDIAAKTANMQAWMAADSDLHNAIYAMADNERAKNTVQNLNDQWHRVRAGFIARTGRLESSYVEHRSLVEAILSGDPEQAEAIMRDHLTRLREELLNILVTMVMPFVSEGV